MFVPAGHRASDAHNDARRRATPDPGHVTDAAHIRNAGVTLRPWPNRTRHPCHRRHGHPAGHTVTDTPHGNCAGGPPPTPANASTPPVASSPGSPLHRGHLHLDTHTETATDTRSPAGQGISVAHSCAAGGPPPTPADSATTPIAFPPGSPLPPWPSRQRHPLSARHGHPLARRPYGHRHPLRARRRAPTDPGHEQLATRRVPAGVPPPPAGQRPNDTRTCAAGGCQPTPRPYDHRRPHGDRRGHPPAPAVLRMPPKRCTPGPPPPWPYDTRRPRGDRHGHPLARRPPNERHPHIVRAGRAPLGPPAIDLPPPITMSPTGTTLTAAMNVTT